MPPPRERPPDDDFGHEREWDDVSCESVEQICLLHVPDTCPLALPDEAEVCSKHRGRMTLGRMRPNTDVCTLWASRTRMNPST